MRGNRSSQRAPFVEAAPLEESCVATRTMPVDRAAGMGQLAGQSRSWTRFGDRLSSIERRRTMAVLSFATVLLMSLIFAPIGIWPLAFVCLVPWLLLTGGATVARPVYVSSFLLALVFYLLNMSWLYEATGWGYVALSIYQSVYWPLLACATRHVVRRRRWSLAVCFPFIWTGGELLRAVVLSGFPWFFLSHSFHGVLTLIQVSDLVGAYGVSFMAAAVNGAVADLILASTSGLRADRVGVCSSGARRSLVFAVVLVLLVGGYGWFQLRRNTTTDGPKIAIIQGDYVNTVDLAQAKGHDRASEDEKMQTYVAMLDAAAKERPDLFLLPETPWMMYLNPEARDFFRLSRASFAALRERAGRLKAVVVTGSASLVPTPDDLLTKERRHNSATVFLPDGSEPQRYDKTHLVYFGEVVPFRSGRLRFLYFWLNRLMPFSGPDGQFEYSVFPGESFRRFTMSGSAANGRSYRFSTPICYEDVMPYLSRAFARGPQKQVDFLLNISNDGWFGRGIAQSRPQQWQHLAVCVFRAIENRVGIARAVNTGISAFIQPSGRVHDVVRGDPDDPWPGQCGYSVAHVGVDSRSTLYSHFGDAFAWACVVVWLLLMIDYWVARVRTREDRS